MMILYNTVISSLCVQFLFGLHAFQPVACNENCKAPTIHAGSSTIEGSCSTFHANELGVKRQVASYRGLRYAKPPVGRRRFTPPELHDLDLKVDGNSGGPSCPQGPHPVYNTESGSEEDCLFLDVFVPLPQREVPLAVLVWLHGGGFMYGAGTVPMLSPLPLVALGDVIVVTINYRLGALGYLTTGDNIIPPNLGIMDQITALNWIRKYISAFGGDPNRVSLFGDSAGSASIHIHLMSPLSSGLFHRAIMQSGASTSSWARSPDLATARNRAHTLGRLVGCGEVPSSAQLLECLEQIPAHEIVAKQQLVLADMGDSADIAFLPVIDHVVIPDTPDTVGKMGSYNNVSLIVGANTDEGMMAMMKLFPKAITTPTVTRQELRHYMSTVIKVEDSILQDLIELVYDVDIHENPSHTNRMYSDRGQNEDEYLSEYMNDGTLNVFDKLNDIVGDMTMFCPTIAVADFAADAGLKVYRYHMTHRPSQSFWRPLTWTRVNHGENLLFVFGVHFLPHLNWTLTPEEVNMTSHIIQYWTNFASSGDPNQNEDSPWLMKDLPDWPLYDPITTDLSKNISPAMTDDSAFKSRECRFWNMIFARLQTHL
ncbi:cholinesterase 2-like isoform X1 [Lytechinus variegatus]|uniref:cholinesterase 2-like isoform X1 n=1 Tax=Lytechinus variegatus TaxID=7654 RepID=UPI001BB221E0|nr:cholinesterase 2-like isoform X1 [Lytechinus variegatus]